MFYRVLILRLRTARVAALFPGRQRGRFGLFHSQRLYCCNPGTLFRRAIGLLVLGGMRFCLRSLFLCVTATAIICAAVGSIRGCYYVQLRAVDGVLSEYPEIDRVWLITNDDVELEVEQVYFSTDAEPELIYRSDGIDTVSTLEFRTRLERALREKRPVELPTYVTEHRR
jgi:hypothetical protein